jgi:hypothetical protein
VKQTRLDEPAGYAKRRGELGDADAFLEGVSAALSSGTQTLRWYAGLDY